MDLIKYVEESNLRDDLPVIRPGQVVRVHSKIVEGNKERIQVYEGTVIRKRGKGTSKTFTVRKISNGIGVEKIFPIYSPRVAQVEVVSQGYVRRAKLYYLRDRIGKAARLRVLKRYQKQK